VRVGVAARWDLRGGAEALVAHLALQNPALVPLRAAADGEIGEDWRGVHLVGAVPIDTASFRPLLVDHHPLLDTEGALFINILTTGNY
jgi:hypothetical protein